MNTGGPRDPDIVEANVAFLRRAQLPRWQKAAGEMKGQHIYCSNPGRPNASREHVIQRTIGVRRVDPLSAGYLWAWMDRLCYQTHSTQQLQ